MKPQNMELFSDDSGPSETFVRFDDLDAFYARCRLDHTRCVIQSLDRKRHGYVCVVVAIRGTGPITET